MRFMKPLTALYDQKKLEPIIKKIAVKENIDKKDIVLVKKNKARAVFKLGDLYCKVFYLKPLQRLFKFDPAQKEFNLSNLLKTKDRTAFPVASVTQGSFSLFISRKINGISLDQFLFETWPHLGKKEQREFFEKFIEFLLDLKECGMFQRDFHLNNIFWDEDSEGFKLIDLHRAKSTGMPLSNKEFLEQLRYLLPPFMKYLSNWDLLRFTSLLSKKIPELRVRSCRLFLVELSYKDMRHQFLKKFSRRTEGVFSKTYKNGLRIYNIKKDKKDAYATTIDFVSRTFFFKREIKDKNIKILKNSRHTLCAKLFFDERYLFLKAYRSSSFKKGLSYLFRRPRAIKAWYASLNLLFRGINTPKPLFLIQGKNPWKSFYGILAYPWLYELDDKDASLKAILLNEKKEPLFLKRLALFIWQMHQRGVFHGDCKITNFYFDKNLKKIGVFDLDAVTFKRDFSNNLAKKDVIRMAKSLDNFLPNMKLGQKFIANYLFLKPNLNIKYE